MKDVVRDLAARQAGCVATWQLLGAGWSPDAVRWRTRGLRRLHDGVFVTGDAPVTRLQHWWAATLTAPGSALVVCRTNHLQATTLRGLPIATPERTLTDLWPRLDPKARQHMLRNALRLKRLTTASLAAHLAQASARHRPQTLTRRLARYEALQLHRCRSDAEALAVVTLVEAGVATPDINVRIAGEEADLSWPDRALIVEIDGGTFHQDKLEDARRTAIWRAAGHEVVRVPAADVYDDPQRLIRAARPGSGARPRSAARPGS